MVVLLTERDSLASGENKLETRWSKRCGSRHTRIIAYRAPFSLLPRISSPYGNADSEMCQVWRLLHGVDDTEVAKAKEVPHQISIVSQGHLISKDHY